MPALDATALEDSMVDSLLSRVKEDWGKLFELVAVEGVTDVETETSLKDLTQTVRKKMLIGTPNAKRATDDRLYSNYLDSVKKACTILMEGLTAQHMSKYVASLMTDSGELDKGKMVEFFDTILKRIDLAVGYSMGLDRVLELMHESIRSEVLGLEDAVGGTKATATMLEGAIGIRSPSLEGSHPILWGSVAELSSTTQQHHDLLKGILILLGKMKEASTKCHVSFSPTSGVTKVSTDGGLSAEPFFSDEGFGKQTGTSTSAQGPTIWDGYVQRRGVQGQGQGNSGGLSGGGDGGSSFGDSSSGRSGVSSKSNSTRNFGGDPSQNLEAGWDKMANLEECLDKLESSQSGGEDAVVLPGDIILRSKQDIIAMLEGFLGANCDIPVGAFTSPHFLFNELMVTLGCTLPNLDEFTKLKRLNVKAIDLRNSQALMAVLPVFFTSSK